MNTIYGINAPSAYCEALWKMRTWAEEQPSRNGLVMATPSPTLLEIGIPEERVLFDPVRNANPFFHVMEAIWMFAGSNDVKFLEHYNRRYRQYAEPNTDIIHGAYGYRWRKHFGRDQITECTALLAKDLGSRRGVINMWDPRVDLSPHNDLPCNTQLLFRVINEALDMTVINRSNDMIWGMLGANVVHMTMLQELMARELGARIGVYRVFTNNLHVYVDMPRYTEIWNTVCKFDSYGKGKVHPHPLLAPTESLADFLRDAEKFVGGGDGIYMCRWFDDVAVPMRSTHFFAKQKRWAEALVVSDTIVASDWRLACQEYIRRKQSSVTSTEPSL